MCYHPTDEEYKKTVAIMERERAAYMTAQREHEARMKAKRTRAIAAMEAEANEAAKLAKEAVDTAYPIPTVNAKV